MLQHGAQVASLGQLGLQECLGAVLLDAFLANPGIHHRANAGASGMQGDAPEPAVLVGLDEYVVLVGFGQRVGPGEVGVHRQVLEEWVPPLLIQVACQQRRLSAGVNHEPALRLAGFSLAVAELHSDRFAIVEDDFGDLVSFQHGDALGAGIVEQYLVELGTPDLIGMRIPLTGLFEVPTPRAVAAAPDHGGPVLGQEPRAFHGGERSQFLQHRYGRGQQRLPNVVPGEPLALQDRYLPALARQLDEKRWAPVK